MRPGDFKPNQRVAYVPAHAYGDLKHPDVEHGIVSSTNGKFVFVKFDKALSRLGWNGATSQACEPCTLVRESS